MQRTGSRGAKAGGLGSSLGRVVVDVRRQAVVPVLRERGWAVSASARVRGGRGEHAHLNPAAVQERHCVGGQGVDSSARATGSGEWGGRTDWLSRPCRRSPSRARAAETFRSWSVRANGEARGEDAQGRCRAASGTCVKWYVSTGSARALRRRLTETRKEGPLTSRRASVGSRGSRPRRRGPIRARRPARGTPGPSRRSRARRARRRRPSRRAGARAGRRRRGRRRQGRSTSRLGGSARGSRLSSCRSRERQRQSASALCAQRSAKTRGNGPWRMCTLMNGGTAWPACTPRMRLASACACASSSGTQCMCWPTVSHGPGASGAVLSWRATCAGTGGSSGESGPSGRGRAGVVHDCQSVWEGVETA